jgi:hypothetical protein
MTDTEQEAQLAILERKLAHGKALLEKGAVKPGQVKLWTGSFAALLKRFIGKENDLSKCIPVPGDPVTAENANFVLRERVEMLEAFIGSFHKAVKGSFCKQTGSRIFIGHGRSPLWRELKDFLADRLGQEWDEFNRESVAGLMTFERISAMLDDSKFAFLIMTGEDELSNQTTQARQNVVHEVGLFQGRLGPRKAIILLEDGCAEFSNIIGLSQIRFPKDHISAVFEEIRRVLERENAL